MLGLRQPAAALAGMALRAIGLVLHDLVGGGADMSRMVMARRGSLDGRCQNDRQGQTECGSDQAMKFWHRRLRFWLINKIS